MKHTLIIALALTISAPSWAAPPPTQGKHAAKSQKKSKAASTPAPAPIESAPISPGDIPTWNTWYTVSVNEDIHYAYYNEEVSMVGDRLRVQTKMWKQEEGYLNEEQLGAFAVPGLDLKPLFFNFHSTYRATETVIDGTILEGKQITVRVRKGQTDLPLIKRSIPVKTYLSTLFPVWIGMRLKDLKPGGATLSFTTLMEDNLELGFAPVSGSVRMDADDDFARENGAKKLVVRYRDLSSIWWVAPTGMALRVEMPSQKTLVQKSTKELAKKFLEE